MFLYIGTFICLYIDIFLWWITTIILGIVIHFSLTLSQFDPVILNPKYLRREFPRLFLIYSIFPLQLLPIFLHKSLHNSLESVLFCFWGFFCIFQPRHLPQQLTLLMLFFVSLLQAGRYKGERVSVDIFISWSVGDMSQPATLPYL